MAVINRIKVVLAEKRLTGKWLAEEIGKSENTISKMVFQQGTAFIGSAFRDCYTT